MKGRTHVFRTDEQHGREEVDNLLLLFVFLQLVSRP